LGLPADPNLVNPRTCIFVMDALNRLVWPTRSG
jgi:hypothetical protein